MEQETNSSAVASKPILFLSSSFCSQAYTVSLISLTLGGTNSSLYSGEIDWIPVSDNVTGYWPLPIDGISVNGVKLGFSTPNAIIDSCVCCCSSIAVRLMTLTATSTQRNKFLSTAYDNINGVV